ncbi:MAG: spore germination protein [Clostridiales bacterium]|nr:spore germination protein [Clostridiales bacterium]
MKLLSLAKKLLIYREPKPYQEFELLEDEPFETEHGPDEGTVLEKTSNPISCEEWNLIRQKSKDGENSSQTTSQETSAPGLTVSTSLQANLQYVKRELHSPKNKDVIIREFKVMNCCDACVVYIDGMADKNTINNFILRQLMLRPLPEQAGEVCSLDYIAENLLAANEIQRVRDIDAAIREVLNGLTALFVDGAPECILVETRGYESRSITEPLNEQVVYGPQEAFVEQLRTNITLIRKIIRSKDLITEIRPIGKGGQISCAMLYVDGIVNPRVVREMKRRLDNINVNITIGTGIVNQLIEERPFSLFPQSLSTERPDRTAAFLMDGQIALILEGSPQAIIVPITFFHLFHTSDDSTLRWQYGNFQRYVRLIACFFAIFLPGLYLALTLYHSEMIPAELMSSLHQARENVPFPAVIEVLLMELSFAIIREAGVRVPGLVGQTLGIIGAIVLGQAAVEAGLVSPVLIIIVAITGLGNFAIPDYRLSYAIRISRFIFIVLGTIAGFYGISAGMYVMFGFACSLKSFGVPYFSPVAPKTESNPDIVTRGPVWTQIQRPDFLNTRNRRRADDSVMGWRNRDK